MELSNHKTHQYHLGKIDYTRSANYEDMQAASMHRILHAGIEDDKREICNLDPYHRWHVADELQVIQVISTVGNSENTLVNDSARTWCQACGGSEAYTDI